MSTNITTLHDDNNLPIDVDSFFGGAERGQSIQLTQDRGSHYIQLTRDQAIELAHRLIDWAAGSR